MTRKLLELFCGTKSVSKVFSERDFEVISLDYNKKFDATHTEDIITWNHTIYSRDYFDVIWASPDCTTWSLASGGKYRKKDSIFGLNNEHQDKTDNANNMILKLIEILKYFNCKVWFIENPRGLLQYYPPLQQFIKDSNAYMNVVYYGNYNDWGLVKPTNIWSNLILWDNEIRPTLSEDKYVLKYHTYDGRMKRMYKQYSFKDTEERSKIPPDLIIRLYNLIN